LVENTRCHTRNRGYEDSSVLYRDTVGRLPIGARTRAVANNRSTRNCCFFKASDKVLREAREKSFKVYRQWSFVVSASLQEVSPLEPGLVSRGFVHLPVTRDGRTRGCRRSDCLLSKILPTDGKAVCVVLLSPRMPRSLKKCRAPDAWSKEPLDLGRSKESTILLKKTMVSILISNHRTRDTMDISLNI
jgi:hypothetical protein